MTDYAISAGDGIVAGEGYLASAGYSLSAAEHVQARASQSYFSGYLVAMADIIAVTPRAVQVAATYNLYASERAVRLSDKAFNQFAILVTQGLTLTDTMHAALGIRLREALALSTALSTVATYNALVTDRLSTGASASAARGWMAAEMLRLSSAASALRTAVANWTDRVALEVAGVPVLQLIVVENDTVAITEAETISAVYHGLLCENVDFYLDVMEPAGGFTTWAMNARTGSITEYQNYAFNSFAEGAEQVYLGAAPDGLYELDGERDQETPIVAAMRNGIMELTGSHLTGLKCVYLAIDGNGEFFLKLTDADGGREVVYSVVARSLKTSRIDIGKGWRSRYLTWELTSTGQAFNLDSLEFLPIQSVRRV